MKTRTIVNIWLVVAIFLPAMVATAGGQTIYVDVDAAGANDGSSWVDAHNYLQDALAAAISGDEIRVAQGVYKPDQGVGIMPRDREATFGLINGVAIRGGYAGFGEPDPDARDIDAYKTILTGDLNGDDGPNFANNGENSYHVVTGSGTDATARLEGFVIIGGNANHWPNNRGGGLYNYKGNLILINCTITGNSASYGGGGIYCKDSSPTLMNCVISGNSADYRGGGMCNYKSNPTLTNCTITNNRANHGGGICCGSGDTTITNSIIWGNVSEDIYLQTPVPVPCPRPPCPPPPPPTKLIISYSCFETFVVEERSTLIQGEGNIDADPLFVDPENSDYHLLADSPCIDAGTNVGVYTDIEGNVRPFDFPGVDNNGDLPDFDIGAYEAVLPTPYETATKSIEDAIANKLKALQRIDAAAEKEWTAYEALEEWLESEDYGDLNKRNIVKAGQRIRSAIQHEEQSKNALEKSIEWLEDALRTLGYEFKPPTLNEPPVAFIGAPENGTVFYNTADTIEIEAYAWDVDGFVVKVEFFADANKVGEDNDRADGWKTTWWHPAFGAHCLTARATDDDGATATSPAVGIIVLDEGKGRYCFPADTGVWVDGELVQISKVTAGQKVGKFDGTGMTMSLKQIAKVEEHVGTFECYDIVLETGNCISVAGSHLFLVESGQWRRVENLQSGSKLKSLQGLINIRSVTKRAVPFTGKVYNLKVKGGERYFAGKDGIIVRDW